MNFPLIANIIVFAILLLLLAQTRHKQWSLAKKVLVGLVITKDIVDTSSKDIGSIEVLSRPFGNLFIRRQLLTI